MNAPTRWYVQGSVFQTCAETTWDYRKSWMELVAVYIVYSTFMIRDRFECDFHMSYEEGGRSTWTKGFHPYVKQPCP